MASYKGHMIGGFAGAAVYTGVMLFLPVAELAEYANLLQGWQAVAAVFVVTMLFALFPDIDTKSKGQGIFYWIAFLLDVLLIWVKQITVAAYLGLIVMLPLLSRHRGWTHSLLAAFVVPLPIVAVPYLYDGKTAAVTVVLYGAAVIGYLSHIAMDGQLLDRLRRLL